MLYNTSMKKAVVKFVVALGVLLLPTQVVANEGLVSMSNLIGGNTRCFASSIMMTNFRYKILVSCRDIVYPAPAGANLFTYVLWAQIGDDKYENLGTLGVGRGEYETKNQFSSLFVTQEQDAKVRRPSDRLIMRGLIEPITLLEDRNYVPPATVAPSPEVVAGNQAISAPAAPASSATTGVSVLRLVGGVLLGIIVFVVIIGFISTRRRRPLE